jgi:signal transduction histidine kinase
MQVGNLAHSLKTPIAVLINEARDMTPAHAKLVRAQAETMQAQVQTYLDRARIAAQRGSVLARTEAAPVIERLVRVMAKLNQDLGVFGRYRAARSGACHGKPGSRGSAWQPD